MRQTLPQRRQFRRLLITVLGDARLLGGSHQQPGGAAGRRRVVVEARVTRQRAAVTGTC